MEVNFYIQVSNGLLKDNHRKRLGMAVWEFMWCIDHITQIDENGIGWVLGKRPVKLREIKAGQGVTEKAISQNIKKLKREDYIVVIYAPYGLIIGVKKAKKRFNQKVIPLGERSEQKVKPGVRKGNTYN